MFNRGYTKIKETIPYYNFIRKFALPSIRMILLSLFIVNLTIPTLAFLFQEFSIKNFLKGFIFGFLVLTIPSIVSDITIYRIFLKKDPLFYLRRCFSLSLFTCLILNVNLIFGAILNKVFLNYTFPNDAFQLSLFILMPIRFLAIFCIASIEFMKKIISSILQPLLCTLSLCISFNCNLIDNFGLLFLASSFGYIFAGFIFVYIEKTGIKRIKIPPLMIFKSFLMDWLDRENKYIEDYLERLSVLHPIKVSTISFKSKSSGKIKGIIVVSNFHPGPFLNVGSSTLPYLIQKIIEKKYDTIVAVPHGISGHELNLPSQRQNEIVIRKVIELLSRSNFRDKSSKLIRVQSGKAQASCQVLNKNALITITLSPFDMEDISPEIYSLISEKWKENFKELIIIDAHNSLENLSFIDEEKTIDIINSINASIDIALKEKSYSIEIGVAKIDLKDFSLSQGIGPGGLRVFLIKVCDQLVSYIVIDGNNMKAGLREKILKAISELGVEDGEVMTTDTHMVNGIISSKFGYYPVGYAIDQKKLLEIILEGVKIAKRNLEEVEVSCASEDVKVKTLGLKTVEDLSEFVKKVARFTLIFIVSTIIFSILIFLIITYL
ncbi:MAG: DUF2070 family protein [Candidatus Bathyarchaeia archaeon]